MKFKAYCVEHNIRQAEIAALLNLELSVVNRKLNGHLPWTLSQVKILCAHYEISADIYFV